jgi:hypothetical protein
LRPNTVRIAALTGNRGLGNDAGAKGMEQKLLAAVNADERLNRLNCEADIASAGGVSVTRRGHHIGLWRWQGAGFSFVPAGYSSVMAMARDIEQALAITHEHVRALG